jgi:nucleoid-associated protein YgaU
MGNFEKLSVLVIGVIIVMILVVAINTWTTDPGAPASEDTGRVEVADLGSTSLTAGGTSETSSGVLDVTTDPWNFEEATDAGGTEALDANGGSSSHDASGTGTSADHEATGEGGAASDGTTHDEPPAPRTVTVKQGDTLGHISLRVYDTTRYWKRIAEANDNIAPEALRPGMVLVIPDIPEAHKAGGTPAGPQAAGPAIQGASYTVRSGDTIQRIAQAAYGSIERWPDVWVENLEVIPDPKRLPVGTQIRIPR